MKPKQLTLRDYFKKKDSTPKPSATPTPTSTTSDVFAMDDVIAFAKDDVVALADDDVVMVEEALPDLGADLEGKNPSPTKSFTGFDE